MIHIKNRKDNKGLEWMSVHNEGFIEYEDKELERDIMKNYLSYHIVDGKVQLRAEEELKAEAELKAYNRLMMARKDAYFNESDPLKNEYDYEKEIGTEESIAEAKQKWIDKVQEIKARYPKPEANTIKG